VLDGETRIGTLDSVAAFMAGSHWLVVTYQFY
jgi:hypothetical protein